MSNSQPEEAEGAADNITISDPDAYNRSQRFKEIHDARQRVSEHIAQMESDGLAYHSRDVAKLAQLVSIYVLELEPIIAGGQVDESEIMPDSLPFDSLINFAYQLGIRPDEGEPVGPTQSMKLYSECNRIYSRIGLDLDIEQGEQTTKIDQKLLEEVDEWRQSNVN